MTTSTVILSRGDIAALMQPADYLAAVERAFRASKEGRAESPPPMHLRGDNGGFHAKGARLDDGRSYVALKLNGNFPHNPQAGLPTIQGAILLCDARNGTLLAIMDSIEITLRRTAAATALAARYLARIESATLTIVGCGDQARAQLVALTDVRPISRCFAFDVDRDKATRFASDMRELTAIECVAVPDLRTATRASDVIVTCTTSTTPVLDVADVSPGTFVAAVGADSAHKHEIAPALMAVSKIVVVLHFIGRVVGEQQIEIARCSKVRVDGNAGKAALHQPIHFVRKIEHRL